MDYEDLSVQDIIDFARAGDETCCGYIYALCGGDPVKLTEIGEDIATAVDAAHQRAIARAAARNGDPYHAGACALSALLAIEDSPMSHGGPSNG